MSQQLLERFSQGSQDPDTSLPLDPTAINSTGLDDAQLQDPTAIVTTTRRPQVKLTAEKLLLPKGLPKIMKEAPKRIRISKRRSSYDNLAHFLQYYQLWAHELFPKAKFHDFVALSRALGKSDRELREYRIELLRQELGISSIGENDIEHETLVTPTPTGEVIAPAMPPSEPPSLSRPYPDETQNSATALPSDDELIYDTLHNTPQEPIKNSQQPNSTAQSQPTSSNVATMEITDVEMDIAQDQVTQGAQDVGSDEDEDEMALMRELGM
ncbi:LANO_0E13674g1_1 [Lachancea nothofagi CBS 11611]|uniref:Chromosome segregation in meiosis protein n=1 Tax=Lachancea nothofagi CBS 11611 TaxID=1266666 RepID=A0A1G4JZ76_9SACH|nr:LANO_0E13674g1_1 [Lachancea nothofagi CBS 11611]